MSEKKYNPVYKVQNRFIKKDDGSFYYYWKNISIATEKHLLILTEGKNFPHTITEKEINDKGIGSNYREEFEKYFEPISVKLEEGLECSADDKNPIFLKFVPNNNLFALEEIRIHKAKYEYGDDIKFELHESLSDDILTFEKLYIGKKNLELFIKSQQQIDIDYSMAVFSYKNELDWWMDYYDLIEEAGGVTIGEDCQETAYDNFYEVRNLCYEGLNYQASETIPSATISQGFEVKWEEWEGGHPEKTTYKVESVYSRDLDTNEEELYAIVIRKADNNGDIKFISAN